MGTTNANALHNGCALNAAELQSTFNRDGFVRILAFWTGEQLDAIERALAKVIHDQVPTMPPEHVFYEEKGRPETLKQIQALHTYDPFFESLMFDSPFRKAAEAALDGPVVPKNLQYFNKPPLVGKATPAHQDGFYFKIEPCEAVTMWFALDSVDETNGCIHYALGSHRLGLLSHGRTDTLGFSQGLIDNTPCENSTTNICCDAQPGDLLAHHALTIHWAGANQSRTRTRRALGFIYYSADAREDTEAHAAYQEQLARELAEQGKI